MKINGRSEISSQTWPSLLPPAIAPKPDETAVERDRVALETPTGTSISTSIPFTNPPTAISGAFIQTLGAKYNQPLDFWRAELKSMKEVGMDTVIVQSSHYMGVDATGDLGRILQAADEAGMKVFVGTPYSASWYEHLCDEKWLAERGKIDEPVIRDLGKRFGSHASFAGWYLPYEVSAIGNAKVQASFYQHLIDTCRETKPGVPVMTSPFSFVATPSTEWWDTFFEGAKLDIVAWQDGLGVHPNRMSEVEPIYNSFSILAKKHQFSFWSNVEIFHRPSNWPLGPQPSALDYIYDYVFDRNAPLVPTEMHFLIKQMTLGRQQADRIIAFDFSHYMSPQGGPAQHKLYQDYTSWLRQGDQSDPPVER